MTTKKPSPRSDIQEMRWNDTDDALIAIYKPRRFRVLCDGGYVVDVIAIRDDSDLRTAVLDATKAPGIIGMTECEEVSDSISYESGPV